MKLRISLIAILFGALIISVGAYSAGSDYSGAESRFAQAVHGTQLSDAAVDEIAHRLQSRVSFDSRQADQGQTPLR